MTVAKEIELKLDVASAAAGQLAHIEPLAGLEPRSRAQRSVYFDDEEHRLRQAGVSLRVRTTGGKRVQTLKTEADSGEHLFARIECEREIAGDTPELDQAEIRLLKRAGVAPPAAVAAVFESQVDRSLWLVDQPGSTIEVVLDEGTVTAGGRDAPVTEIELEIRQGDPDALFALGRAVMGALPARLGVLTKADRGYALLETQPSKSWKAPSIALVPGMSSAAAFQLIVRSCLVQFRRNEDLLLASGDAAPLHQARVALRRLRSAFSLFNKMLDDPQADHLRQELRWLAGQLGEVRNLDVLLGRTDDPELVDPLRTAREKAYDSVLEALSSLRARILMLDLAQWAASGDWLRSNTSAMREQPIEEFAEAVLDKYRRRMKRSGKKLASVGDEERHEVRILGKKLRYAAEFFSGLHRGKKITRRRKHFMKALEELQGHLGDLNDYATGEAVLRDVGIAPDKIPSVLGAALDRRKLLSQADEAYHDLVDAKRYWR